MPVPALLLVPVVFLASEVVSVVVASALIGALPTLALLVLDVVLGAALLRGTGLAAARALDQGARSGATPLRPIVVAGCRAIAALLLMCPGFLSDAVAIALLALPAVQDRLLHVWSVRRHRPAPTPRSPDGPIIDAEWHTVTPNDPTRPGERGP